jgi:hypothetical protein
MGNWQGELLAGWLYPVVVVPTGINIFQTIDK